ncbi:MAG: hypothetical protein WC881_10645, partial [Elusimicrobiota bacterium]
MNNSDNFRRLMIVGAAVLLNGAAQAGPIKINLARPAGRGAAVPAGIGAAKNPAAPALSNGVSLPLQVPGLNTPPAPQAQANIAPQGLPAAQVPAVAALAAPAGSNKEPVSALGAAEQLAAGISEAGTSGEDQAQAAASAHFDGSIFKVGAAAAPGMDGMGSDGGARYPLAAPINNRYPRVVFIQDVFKAPASEQTVAYLEKLVDAGVHLVFLTSRPLKGEGSAEEILLGRMKARRSNPIIVASYNGARITLHGRAANPKPILEDMTAFRPSDIAALSAMGPKVAKALGLAAGLSIKENTIADGDSVLSFEAELPDAVSGPGLALVRAKMIGAYNRWLKASGLPYRMEGHPDNPRAVVTHALPLRFSLPRVMAALDEQFPGENLAAASEKFLILADSQRSPKFSSAFPKQAEVQVASDGGGIEEVLAAMLGDRKLPTVSIKLGKLRQFVEYWEPAHRYSRDEESSGGRSNIRGADRVVHQKFAMYTGTTIYQLMAWFYEQIWRGQHQTLFAVQDRLRSMWYNPLKFGVYVNKPLAAAMKTTAWTNLRRGYLNYANSYVTNFYMREFGDYQAGARNVEFNMIGLVTDQKSLITLDFVSPSTQKIYKVHTRIPRVMKMETAEGHTLIAYSYRTGKETPDDGEEFLAQILAMSLLKGHARKGPDGKWHHGSADGQI